MGGLFASKEDALRISKIRKAVAAFVAPLLSLPLVNWIIGVEVWDAGKLIGALLVGVSAAVAVWVTPNAV